LRNAQIPLHPGFYQQSWLEAIAHGNARLVAQKGMHRSKALRKWLDRVTEGKTCAANVSTREYKIYSKQNRGSRPIAEAVHASVKST
jgi:hypothetical protein